MKRYEYETGSYADKAPSYVCGLAEFKQETTAPDGAGLEVVDEDKHTVVAYYLAYNGYWNKR